MIIDTFVMKHLLKKYKIVHIVFAMQLFIVHQSSAQLSVPNYVQKYFRVNPYSGKMGSFLKALKTDEDFEQLKEILKTDTSNYFLQGKYKNFNPFSVKDIDTYIIFEASPTLITDENNKAYEDSNEPSYSYILVGVFNDDSIFVSKIKKEFRKIYKSIKNSTTTAKGLIKPIATTSEIVNGETFNIVYPFLNGSIMTNDFIKWEQKNNRIFFVIHHTIFPSSVVNRKSYNTLFNNFN